MTEMDAIAEYRNRRQLRLDIERYKQRRDSRSKDVHDDGDWEEDKHPRSKDGQFAAKGAGEARSEKADPAPSKTPKLAVEGHDAQQLYDKILAGDYLDTEELMKHPAVQELERKSQELNDRIGDTSKIWNYERRMIRRKARQDFLATGSARTVEKDGKRTTTFDGPLKKGYKACIVIGLPASGKSSGIVEPYSEKTGSFVLDPDRVKEYLPEYHETNGAAAASVHRESQDILFKARETFEKGHSNNGVNMVVPIIGDHGKDVGRWIEWLEDNGYSVKVKYREASLKDSLNRNVKRGLETGRITPTSSLLKRGDPKKVYEYLKGKKGKDGKPYAR